MLRQASAYLLVNKGYSVTSVLTERFLEKFGLALPAECFFLRMIKRASDTFDLLSAMIHERPLQG